MISRGDPDLHRGARIGLVAGLAILVGIAVWRLSSGPVAVDFLTPYLEAAFNESEEGAAVDIGSTVVSWEGWSRNIDLRANRIRISDDSGGTLAVLPDVAVTLELPCAGPGNRRPDPDRDPRAGHHPGPRNGRRQHRIRHGHAEAGPAVQEATGVGRPVRSVETQGEVADVLPALLDELFADPGEGTGLAYLTAVRIVEGRASLKDPALDVSWQAGRLNVRNCGATRPGLAGGLDFDLGVGPKRRRTSGSGLLYDTGERTGRASP